jgi:hypothetical protein
MGEYDHRWRYRKYPVDDWDQGPSAGLRHGQRCRVVARRGDIDDPYLGSMLVQFDDGTMMVGVRGCVEPVDQRQIELF